jgi:hypothetical protein
MTIERNGHQEAQGPARNAVPEPRNLSDRVAGYKLEIERMVREVGEHPLCEMKRSLSLQTLADKIEFVKDVQSIATSRIETEKFLVVGADETTRSFCPMRNAHEFDESTIRMILEKYLSPAPEFEIFQMTSEDGSPYVLVVIPKQRKRRILAKVTVQHPTEGESRVVLREGDLWTKAGSTAKRLARPEDWDEIYNDIIESETEQRTRQRTAHALELATAREKVRPVQGQHGLPSFFNDDEFQALMEDLCSAGVQGTASLNVLLERFRDDLVEGWHRIGAYEESKAIWQDPHLSIATLTESVRQHIANVFRPAMHWLCLAGLYVVKNCGPVAFLDSIAQLFQEIFETSGQLRLPRRLMPTGAQSSQAEDHISHTVPALESVVSLHIIGAYIAKRRRFQYLGSLFRHFVFPALAYNTGAESKAPMVYWPLDLTCGEPEELHTTGRINYCSGRIEKDSAYHRLFGSAEAATRALCQFELCLELNSYLAFDGDRTKQSSAYIAAAYPGINFYFRPSLIAFPLEHIHAISLEIYDAIKTDRSHLLEQILFDPALVAFLKGAGRDAAFLNCLRDIESEHGRLFLAMRRFRSMLPWPAELDVALKKARSLKA